MNRLQFVQEVELTYEKTTLIWKITMTTEKPKNGLHTEYYDKGQMKLEENYKDGKFEGKSTMRYKNDQMKYEGNYKDSKKDGKWTRWCCDGTLRTEENYKDGELLD